MPDLVPIADAAAELQIHRATLYRYVKEGRITGYRRGIGSGTFVDRRELRRLATFKPVNLDKRR